MTRLTGETLSDSLLEGDKLAIGAASRTHPETPFILPTNVLRVAQRWFDTSGLLVLYLNHHHVSHPESVFEYII